MERSIGIVEFRSIAMGIGAVDAIVKTYVPENTI